MAARCPACNAALRADAQWCSLCYHDLRPAPVAAPVQVPAPSQPLYGGSDPLTAPLLDLVLPPVPPAAVVVPQPSPAPESAAPVQSALQEWPCTSCGARNPLATTTCSVCGSKFLAAASEELSLVVPGVGDLQRLSRGQRIALAGGVLALVLVPLAAITFFLTPEPAQQPTGGSTDTTVTIVK